MREIKFRFWYQEENRMIYQDDKEYELFWNQNSGFSFNGAGECVGDWALNEEQIQQFTGLQDKNGKDIYEGDIVNIIHPCWTNKSTVEFLNGSFVFKSNESITENVVIPGYTFIKETWEVEVIGNIFENPELIN